ncbi:efflux RND transporter periplasmic adaptor subunit [Malikia spinosa]|jgi:HlyD family secretion protein|uniref:Efflux RND transporter periplasmic adaptor subunit n=1 Tax=Malikia spinosa TaxID=86180 RepID=A0A2S9KEH8_9BURK|nr:efflux RND transporter periplasmic adaptor subunit [Malikia spinosa]MYZ52388.1 efflux RND transporter periplasmic adaptor subunit [Malikia spinosa]PRD68848.1 efflux RND transporter periplasmic adaptor subunit [Malikia spinosa]
MIQALASKTRKLRLAIPLSLLALAVIAFATLRAERVEVARVEQGDMRQAVVASGRVRTPERVELASQITARVSAIMVREGDTVSAGQLLLQLDPDEWQASVEQARASMAQAESRLRQISESSLPLAEQTLRQAQANARQTARHHQRVSELVTNGFYSPAQLDDVELARDVAASQLQAAQIQVSNHSQDGSEVRLARSNVDQARAALAVAQARLDHATLRAPVAGQVLTRHAESGATVQPGKLLLTLAPDVDTELTAQIDEKNFGLLALGQRARVSADAYPSESFDARVSYIAPSIDAQRGSVEIRLAVPQAPAYLRHDMTVSIDIEAAQRPDALSVPCDSLRDIAGMPWVMAVRDNRTVRQAVRLGLRGSGRCEVVDGLKAGEAVLVAGDQVSEGRRVTTVERK